MTECLVDCQCHVSPITHVPCCLTHRLPLYAAEAGNGQCPWIGPLPQVKHVGGGGFGPKRCITWAPFNWLWLRRDLFDWRDLPPHNGMQAPRWPSPGAPMWERETHHCDACKADTLHVSGDNRSVCTGCGAAAWVPDPQYVNAGDAS